MSASRDTEELRQEIIEKLWGMANYIPAALAEITEVETATKERMLEIQKENDF